MEGKRGVEVQATLHGKIFKGFLFNVDWPRNVTVQRIPSPKAVPSCSGGRGGGGAVLLVARSQH